MNMKKKFKFLDKLKDAFIATAMKFRKYVKISQIELDYVRKTNNTQLDMLYAEMHELANDVWKKKMSEKDATSRLNVIVKTINNILIKNRKIRVAKSILNATGTAYDISHTTTNEVIFLLGDTKMLSEKLAEVKRACGKKKALTGYVQSLDSYIRECDSLYKRSSETLTKRNKERYIYAPAGLVA